MKYWWNEFKFIFMLLFFPDRCQDCGSKKIDIKITSMMDNTVCEEDYFCSECQGYHNSYAYGSYEIPRHKNYFDRCEWVEDYLESL